MADVITYDTLYEYLRKEKYQNEIQPLPSTFFSDVINYLSEKEAILESQKEKKSIFSAVETQKTVRQIENTKKIIRELYERRETKIINIAMLNIRSNLKKYETKALLPEELALLEELQTSLGKYKEGILHNLLLNKLPDLKTQPKSIKTPKKESELTKLVRILNPIPKFMGVDMHTYGPFEQEDMVNLPKKIAKLLIKNKKAEPLK